MRLYPGGVLVEVGNYLGRSLCHLGQLVRDSGKPFTVVGVDWCRGSGVENGEDHHATALEAGHGTLAGQLHRNIIACGLQDTITLIVGNSVPVSRLFADDSLTMVFLDAQHDEVSVKADITAWLRKVRSGGVIAGDDMGIEGEPPVWPGVGAAVKALLPGFKYQQHDAWMYEKR